MPQYESSLKQLGVYYVNGVESLDQVCLQKEVGDAIGSDCIFSEAYLMDGEACTEG